MKTSSDRTQKKPFFSRKIGLADIFRFPNSTQPTSDKTLRTLDASSSLHSSPNVEGITWAELQNLPTGRLRRPDTETGFRALTTDPNELARSPWKFLTIYIAYIIIIRTALAIALGGVGYSLQTFPDYAYGAILFLFLIWTAVNTTRSIYQAVKELRNV